MRKSFGSTQVLDGVSLDLHRGENVVVLGPSGTGKSVLAKIVVGLLEPDSGSVEVLGQPIHALSGRALDALRVRIGFSFQHSALYDSMSVAENIAFPLRMNESGLDAAMIDDRVTEVLEAVGLAATRDQMPAELSGGQRKRIGIARTLVLRPEILVYDEPTAGLDPITCAELNELVLEVRERFRTSSLIITHDLTSARATGDRLIMLHGGHVIGHGGFDALFASTDPRIRSFYDYNFIRGAPP
ncbi:MAG: ATP-binding cassette domain-containing protein [Myxococcales bacterium]|nr:ATP-binding cassette domain-containing protein [Myxococcales bacterium]